MRSVALNGCSRSRSPNPATRTIPAAPAPSCRTTLRVRAWESAQATKRIADRTVTPMPRAHLAARARPDTGPAGKRERTQAERPGLLHANAESWPRSWRARWGIGADLGARHGPATGRSGAARGSGHGSVGLWVARREVVALLSRVTQIGR